MMKKYGNIVPTEAERVKMPRSEVKTAAAKEQDARTDALKPKAKPQ